ncbi:MAG: SurA N-terminal domain-containing protein [Gemmatimonadota bacterium]
MMMQTIREKTRWAIVFLAVAFAAWLAFEGIQSRETSATSGANPVIAVVDGEDIRYTRWREVSSRQIDQARAEKGGALTDEETRQAEEQAWENMIRNVLVEQEVERLGIEVSNTEVQQAFRTSPPPFVMQNPAFQTDGQFDYAKYQQFFSDPSVDEQLLLNIEQYYRDILPRQRLEQQLATGASVSDAAAWEEFKAQNETAVATYVTVDPSRVVDDAEISVPEEEARRHYRENRDDSERPATATVRIYSISTTPSASDSARIRTRADSIRTAILDGEMTFEEAVEEFSIDSTTAADGGRLGRFGPEELDEPLASAVAGLDAGEISGPVTSSSGVHLARVDERTADTVAVSHLVLRMRLSQAAEDELFGRMDEVEGIALEDGLLAARDSLGIEVREGVTLTEGFDFVPGAGSLGVGVDWALDDVTEIGELSEFYENGSGFHLLELVDRTEAGRFSFEEVRDQIEATLRAERREAEARRIAEAALDELEDPTIEALAEATGWPVDTTEAFGRQEFVPGLGRDTEAVGAAFAAPLNEVTGPYDAGDHLVILRVDERTEADRELFAAMKGQMRRQVAVGIARQRASQWLEALRDEATVVDHRDRLDRSADAQPAAPPPMM